MLEEFSVELEASPEAGKSFVGVKEDVFDFFFSNFFLFVLKKSWSGSVFGRMSGSGFSKSLDPDYAKCPDPDSVNTDPKHWIQDRSYLYFYKLAFNCSVNLHTYTVTVPSHHPLPTLQLPSADKHTSTDNLGLKLQH
jgi:hypothetical protein